MEALSSRPLENPKNLSAACAIPAPGGCNPLMIDDAELLRRYVDERSEPAFAELVQRKAGLVYSAALRQVNGDAHLAQDVAQAVFTDLARKAGSLARRESLTGWLYTSAHFAAAKTIRTETRRRDREEIFMRESEGSGTGVPPVQSANEQAEWENLRPLLDAGVDTLVLGCTHYPLLARVIARVAGPEVALVDSAEAVAEVVAGELEGAGLVAPGSSGEPKGPRATSHHHLCVTDAGESFQRLADRILREPGLPLEWVEVV